MNKDWQPKQFRDIIDIKHGYPFKGEFFSTSGEYILLTPGNFFEAGGFKRVTAKDKYYLGEFPKEYIHKKNDLIVAMTEQAEGLLGSCALVPEDNLYLHNQRLGHITMNEKEVDKKFIYYLFQMKYIRKQIRLTSTGSKVKHTSPERIYDVELFLPPFIEQQKIASILSSLDKKIEINNKINKNLEAMAKTLYDYWFVQFDFPDDNGKPYKSSGGKMVYSEELKREIPEGWGIQSLGELGEFKNGVNYDPSAPGIIPCPIINVRNISASSFFIESNNLDVIYLDKKDVEKYAIKDNDIIIARSGISGATRLMNNYKENTLFCGFTIRYQLRDIQLKNKIFFYLKSIEKMISSGSGGTILKNVNQDTLKGLKSSYPIEKELIQNFNKIIEPTFDKINLLQEENQKLTQLRDWLLPMLMNGQVGVELSTT